MFKPVLLLSIATLLTNSAFGQDVWDDYSPWEHAIEGEVVLALASNDGEPVLGAVSVTGKTTYIFESGLIVGAVGQIAVQKDHPARAGFSGVGHGYTGSTTVTAPYSGLSTTATPEDIGPRAGLEAAYLLVEGGYGELRIGRDEGVAARFHEGPEPIMQAANISNPRLDPLGTIFARTNHDMTGPSTKVSVMSPRILGLIVGASYTPDADVRGLDRDIERQIAGAPALSIEDTWEVALNGSRRLRKSGLRIKGALAWSTAQVSSATLLQYGRMNTVSAGLSVAGDSWMVGVDHAESDNGIRARASDYTATTVGVSKQWGKTRLGVFHANMRDEFLEIDSNATSIELGYQVLSDLDVAIAFQDTALKPLNQATFQANSPDKRGFVVEITRRF